MQITRFYVRRLNYALAFGAALLLVGTVGCKDAAKFDAATVHGKITYNKKPVPNGTIINFLDDKGNSGTATVAGTDGKYKCKDAPIGKCRVNVLPPVDQSDDIPTGSGDDKPAGEIPDDPEEKLIFPKKYQLEDTSGLTTVIKKGDNEYNPNLKD